MKTRIRVTQHFRFLRGRQSCSPRFPCPSPVARETLDFARLLGVSLAPITLRFVGTFRRGYTGMRTRRTSRMVVSRARLQGPRQWNTHRASLSHPTVA